MGEAWRVAACRSDKASDRRAASSAAQPVDPPRAGKPINLLRAQPFERGRPRHQLEPEAIADHREPAGGKAQAALVDAAHCVTCQKRLKGKAGLFRQAGSCLGEFPLLEEGQQISAEPPAAIAFACQALYVQRQLEIPDDRLNVNGGAIALGHPLGCTGAKLTATALHELARRGGRRAIVTMCIGGGQGAAALFERA